MSSVRFVPAGFLMTDQGLMRNLGLITFQCRLIKVLRCIIS